MYHVRKREQLSAIVELHCQKYSYYNDIYTTLTPKDQRERYAYISHITHLSVRY